MNWYGIDIDAYLIWFLVASVLLFFVVLAAVNFPKLRVKFTETHRGWSEQDILVRLGVYVTAGLFFLTLFISGLPSCPSEDCPPKLVAFLNAPPNEVGDTLAGFAGALAFLWIIVTVLLQSKELAAQREELSLSRSEYEKMAKAMEAQLIVLQDEAEQRTETRSKEHLDVLLDNLRRVVRTSMSEEDHFGIDKELSEFFSEFEIEAEDEEFYNALKNISFEIFYKYRKTEPSEERIFGPLFVRTLRSTIVAIEEILEVSNGLSSAQKRRLEDYHLTFILSNFERVLERDPTSNEIAKKVWYSK